MSKSHNIKSNHSVLRKNEVDTYGAKVFGPDYSTTVLTAKSVLSGMSILCILDFYDLNLSPAKILILFGSESCFR
jgi:hypothetical protein